MENNKQMDQLYGQFIKYQERLHEKNQRKIRIGLKVNILLPLVFLIISFMSDASKLVFLVLWIVSLFGIAFYLLYVEYTDTKMQEKMQEFGLVEEGTEHDALIGSEVLERIDDLENLVDLEVFDDIKELRAGIKGDIRDIKKTIETKRVEKKGGPYRLEVKDLNEEEEDGGDENE